MYLTELIRTALSSMGSDPIKAVAQCYDRAAAMSGVKTGVQERIRENYEKAVYVHCWAHRLNLVLVNACCDTPHVLDFFSTHFLFWIYSAALKVPRQTGVTSK